jgi:DNA-binding response OmpR family regulator
VAKLLIVDDERGILNALQRVLKPHGYAVEVAEDGEEAMAKLATFSPDLVLADYRLPGMNGIHLLEKARHMAPGAVRVLMAASPDSYSLSAAYSEKTLDHFILKPWTNEMLLERLQEWLTPPAQPKP